MSVKNKIEPQNEIEPSFLQKMFGFESKILWPVFLRFILTHIVAFYGFMTFPYSTHKLTIFWILCSYIFTGFGVTAGIHRYWTHRTFKAKLPLRLIMAVGYYASGMLKMYDWIIIHRVHHKYTDTDADPHNAKRGFFFSHFGWLLMKRHPEYYKHKNEIDMSDIEADPIVKFGDKYYALTTALLAFILPSLVPIFLWNEHWYYASMAQIMRYILVLHATLLVNSAAHLYGSKPFNKNIMPSTNYLVQFFAIGEGFHNYHHTFPWDYRTGEMVTFNLNLTKYLLDQFAKIGWAYDLKTASDDLIKETCRKRGDGTYKKLWEEIPAPK